MRFGRFGRPVSVWCKTNDQTVFSLTSTNAWFAERFETKLGLIRTNRSCISYDLLVINSNSEVDARANGGRRREARTDGRKVGLVYLVILKQARQKG